MVRLRLARHGRHNDPHFRIVAADQRGRVLEELGHYHPRSSPSGITLDVERARERLDRGAQPSDAVRKLLRTQGL
jgi:small subunit ribosomal protein S16